MQDAPSWVRHWWRRGARSDPRVAKWGAIAGITDARFAAFMRELVATPPIITVVGDLDDKTIRALAKFGRVVRVPKAELGGP